MSEQQVIEEPKLINKSQEIRDKVLFLEEQIRKLPEAMVGDNEKCPLKHTFVDGAYVREIFMPKGMLIVSKIHKIKHPYFILKGDVSVLTESGAVRIKAPFYGVTRAGTKRALYIHEDCIWVTVHTNYDNGEDLDKIEERIIAKTFDELPNNIVEVLGEVLYLEGKNESLA